MLVSCRDILVAYRWRLLKERVKDEREGLKMRRNVTPKFGMLVFASNLDKSCEMDARFSRFMLDVSYFSCVFCLLLSADVMAVRIFNYNEAPLVIVGGFCADGLLV